MSASILIVDDDPHIRGALADLLRDEGYRVLVAHHGRDALRVLGQERPQLILVDVVMPVMDGPAFIAEVRTRVPLRNVPIVVMTGTVDRVPPRLGLPLVTKPIEIHSLLDLVRHHCAPDDAAGEDTAVPAAKAPDDDSGGFDCCAAGRPVS